MRSGAAPALVHAMNNPSWWNDKHDGVWDRIKSALKRDWEQTKADLTSDQGRELNQGVGDTLSQAAGKEPLPPDHMPNPPEQKFEAWEDVEPDYRFGAGARQQHGATDRAWNDRVESKLSEEWKDLKSGRTWDEVKSRVRRGWDHDGAKK